MEEGAEVGEYRGVGFLTSKRVGLLIPVAFIKTEANKGETCISGAPRLQLGRARMQAASTVCLSIWELVFQMRLAAEKSNSCPGCELRCCTRALLFTFSRMLS